MKKLVFLLFILILYSCSKFAACGYYDDQQISTSPNKQLTEETQRERFDTLINGTVVQFLDSTYLFQDDILMRPEQLWLVGGSPMGRSSFMLESSYYWSQNTVYYVADEDFIDHFGYTFEEALSMISESCGIIFRPRPPAVRNYIRFKKSSDGNNSYYGMIGGEQIINIQDGHYVGIIMHEILHALGFFHEHSRMDRDSYINIHWSNILPDYRFAFDTHNFTSYSGTDFGPFDFTSVMMYGSRSFCIDNSIPTITKLDGSLIYAQRDSLSYWDIEGLRRIYGPPYHRLEITTDAILEDYLDYTEERSSISKKAVIKFYEDKACTIETCTVYPRLVGVTCSRDICHSYGDRIERSIQSFDIIVPAGVDSLIIEQYINREDYLYSNPLYIDKRSYSLINSQVPQINQ